MSKGKERYSVLMHELEKQHLTMRQLALRADIIPSNLYLAISGDMKFWPGWRTRVAEVLGVSAEDLFKGVDGDE